MLNPENLLGSFNGLNNKQLEFLNNSAGWSLNIQELQYIQTHFKKTGRQPSLGEIETIAQTWSEHCKHKTFTGPILYKENGKTQFIPEGLFKKYIQKATIELSKPWCLSVFKDNAGVVKFGKSGKWALAFKAETHNHPCAIEPYGGAETGVGGVVRDVLGVGLGAKPVLNTDIFCFAPPGYKKNLPKSALSPERIFKGVVAGVRDYGNRMGIPTAAGAIHFDEGYMLNPLVFVGTVGIMPVWAVSKKVNPGDIIFAAGGRTGRDGLHGATFSSASLENASASAVQIGHAINEKKALDCLLKARDKKLYRAVTDCGAGGFSSAIGELGSECGAKVHLEKAKLKDSNILPWEIWVSESQERMIFAVPPENLRKLEEIFDAENCEHAVLGTFTGTGRLVVTFHEETIIDIGMDFLHSGLPKIKRSAVWKPQEKIKTEKLRINRKITVIPPEKGTQSSVNPCHQSSGPAVWRSSCLAASPSSHPAVQRHIGQENYGEILKAALSHLNVCSREPVIQQYDHEVQGGTVIKPLQGKYADGPGDACVIWPRSATGDMSDFSGFAVSHGINPAFGKLDPYWMALSCADEAVRNLLCAGADITKCAFLDNFCWGSPEDPELLGELVRCAKGCYEASKAYEAPFISGKDSFYNRSKDADGKNLDIPSTILISASAPVNDIRKALTMDIKSAGNLLYIIGETFAETGGSIYSEITGVSDFNVPKTNPKKAFKTYKSLLSAINKELILSAHDLSQGGLGACIAEMAFSGDCGADIKLKNMPFAGKSVSDSILLFSESQSRILMEIHPENKLKFLKCMAGAVCAELGRTTEEKTLKITGLNNKTVIEESLENLKDRWKRPLCTFFK